MMYMFANRIKNFVFSALCMATFVTPLTAYAGPSLFDHPAIKTKFCEPYLWSPQVPTEDRPYAAGPFSRLPNEDYTIRDGGLYLNPTSRQVFYQGKKTVLGPTDYIFFEALVLADGAAVDDHDFINEGIAAHEARANGREEPQYEGSWVGTTIKRLRTKLKDVFGKDLADRLITLRSRGYAWTTGAMLSAAETFPQDKVTYLYNQQRVFVGAKETVLTERDMALLKAFVDSKTRHLPRETMVALFESMGREISDEGYHRMAVARLNRGLRDMLGTDRNAITSERLSEVYVLDAKFLDIRRM